LTLDEKPLVQTEAKSSDFSSYTVDNTNISPVTEAEKEEPAGEEEDLEIPAFIRRKMKNREQ